MRARELIIEAPKKASKFNWPEGQVEYIITPNMIEDLHRECSVYVKGMRNPLWRGIKYDADFVMSTEEIRTDRRPADSSALMTAAFNYLFEKNTGVPYIRNITSYATTDFSVAKEYGQPVLVYPLDETQFVRSVGISDLYIDVFSKKMTSYYTIIRKYLVDKKGMNFYSPEYDQAEAKINTLFNKITETRGKITAKEIDNLFGKEYINLWKQFIEPLEEELNSYYLYDGYHKEFNKAREEIMMFGTDWFYVINPKAIYDMIQRASESGKLIFLGNNPAFDLKSKSWREISEIIVVAIREKKPLVAIMPPKAEPESESVGQISFIEHVPDGIEYAARTLEAVTQYSNDDLEDMLYMVKLSKKPAKINITPNPHAPMEDVILHLRAFGFKLEIAK